MDIRGRDSVVVNFGVRVDIGNLLEADETLTIVISDVDINADNIEAYVSQNSEMEVHSIEQTSH